jgi:hypothetical protein
MNATNGGAGVLISSGGNSAGVEYNDSRLIGFGGAL